MKKTFRKRSASTGVAAQPPGSAPRWRSVLNRRNSICESRDLFRLDWMNWWEDNGYIHVRAWSPEEDETWHRVYPRPLEGMHCARVGMMEGQLKWIYDQQNDKAEPTPGVGRSNS